MKIIIKTNLIELEITDKPIDSDKIGSGRDLPDIRDAVKSIISEAIKLHESVNARY